MATLSIGKLTYEVTTQKDSRGATQYLLKGVRGALYGTMRTLNQPELMFLVDARGFGMPQQHRGVWLTDKNGTLEVLKR